MTIYTKIGAEGQDLPADAAGHQAVRVEHPLLAKPIIFSAFRSPKELTYKKALKWAEELDVNGWSWRMAAVDEALFLPDRSKYPALDPNYFPDFARYEWLWTSTVDAESPSEFAWVVGSDGGYSGRLPQGFRFYVRAVRAGQF